MLADLDLLLIAVFCAADDLLPKRAKNARRIVTDAEVVTLAVAQSIMGIPSDPRFLAVAAKRLNHLFPRLPKRPGFHKRRAKLAAPLGGFCWPVPPATARAGKTIWCWSTRPRWSAAAPARRSNAP